jgi:hypothetical protein
MSARLSLAARRDFDPVWFFVPVLLTLVMAGSFLLAGVIEQLPAASAPAAESAPAPTAA